jgi:hypothetical protein
VLPYLSSGPLHPLAQASDRAGRADRLVPLDIEVEQLLQRGLGRDDRATAEHVASGSALMLLGLNGDNG